MRSLNQAATALPIRSTLSQTHQQQLAFTAHIRDGDQPIPSDIPKARMQVYESLMHNATAQFINSAFPVSKSIIDEDTWALWTRRFLKSGRSETPYFHKISEQFLHFFHTQTDIEKPPFLDELLHYEWAELALDTDEADPFPDASLPEMPDDTALLECVPVWSPVAWSFVYQWPVHQISESFQPETPPETPTCILVYRNRENQVHFMGLNPISAMLAESINNNEEVSIHTHLTVIANQIPSIPTENVIAGGLQLIREFCQLGIITHVIQPSHLDQTTGRSL